MDWLKKYHPSPDMLREIGKKLNLNDVISFCSSSHYFRKHICNQFFWKEYLSQKYPRMIQIDDQWEFPPIEYSKYSPQKIIDTIREVRKKHSLQRFFPHLDPAFFQGILKEYVQKLFDYLIYALDLDQETVDESMIVELEKNTQVKGKPRSAYLAIRAEGEIELVTMLEVALSSPPSSLHLDESGIIIGETYIEPSGSPEVVYSSQMTDQDLGEAFERMPGFDELDPIGFESGFPLRERIPEIRPQESPEKVMKFYLSGGDPHGGIYIPLEYDLTTYSAKGKHQSSILLK